MKRISTYFFPFLIAFSAIALAACAAYFSVTGLSKLFAGAQKEVIVMASMLELGKIVTASWLHRNWKIATKALKTRLVFFVIVLMLITSAGIYGFLSHAYTVTSSKMDQVKSKVERVEKKVETHEDRKERYKKRIEDNKDKLQQLNQQKETYIKRNNQVFDKKGYTYQNINKKIEEINDEINQTEEKIDKYNDIILKQENKISDLSLKKDKLSNSDVAAELGPLRYISELSGKSMDTVVNWFILALIFVFDPLAVSLVVATNISFERAEKKLNNKDEDDSKNSSQDSSEVSDLLSYKDTAKEFFEEKEKKDEEFKKTIDQLRNDISSEENKEYSKQNEEENVIEENEEDDQNDQSSEDEEEYKEKIKEEDEEEENNIYLTFLYALYNDGQINKGEKILSYSDFTNKLENEYNYDTKKNETIIRDFLKACNLLSIIDTNKNKREALKDYKEAKEILKLVYNS